MLYGDKQINLQVCYTYGSNILVSSDYILSEIFIYVNAVAGIGSIPELFPIFAVKSSELY